MHISENTAFYIQATGGIAALALATPLYLATFGRVCYVPSQTGTFVHDSERTSYAAAAVFGSCVFYTGFNVTSRIVRSLVDVDTSRVQAVAKKSR